MDKFFFTSEPISASDNPYFFEESYINLPATYSLDGEEHNLIEGLEYFSTEKLVTTSAGAKYYVSYRKVDSADLFCVCRQV